MIAYVGQTRSAALCRQLSALGVGECTTRGELGPRRSPWFYDNGAYSDFANGRAFNLLQFVRDLRALSNGGRGRSTWAAPAFAVLPDIVAGGAASLQLSLDWARGEWYELPAVPWFLAVQDGMSIEQIGDELQRTPEIAGLFVGGSLPWKLASGAAWCELGAQLGRPVHVGRVGTPDRVAWARAIGASSIDSALPLWSGDKLSTWVAALGGSLQTRMRF